MRSARDRRRTISRVPLRLSPRHGCLRLRHDAEAAHGIDFRQYTDDLSWRVLCNVTALKNRESEVDPGFGTRGLVG